MTEHNEWRTTPWREDEDKWCLPTNVFIDGVSHAIRNKCDYRVVLDCISALNDVDLTDEEKIKCALYIFYDDISRIEDWQTATVEMYRIISGGEMDEQTSTNKPRLMDWEHDYRLIAPPVSRVLGYDVRNPDVYTHWYTWLGGYMEIGECTFATIVSIRSKRAKGKKLDKWEVDYLREHRKEVELPIQMTAEEQAELHSEW